MKLCTIGLGYIGLPTAIMFAKHDVNVVGVDIDPRVIDSLNRGVIHIEEPGLQEALEEVLEKGTFSSSLNVEQADVYIVAVPTPNLSDQYKSCDLSYVLSAVNRVIPYLEIGNVLIIESTISPRSMDDFIKPLVEKTGFIVGKDIHLVHCPERVLPGQILHELVNNNRIIGGITPQCTDAGADVYRTFVKGEIIKTDAKTAEMSKLMENTYRDVNIALANELTQICHELEIDALEVIKMANKHPRVQLHSPGPGVGGHCLAVDPYFIISKSPKESRIIQLSREINTSMPNIVVKHINTLMKESPTNVLTLFGLTYKGNVDDTRESPAIEILAQLKEQGKYEVRCFDPHVLHPLVETNIQDALKDSSLIVILTDHDEFKTLNGKYLSGMERKRIFDTKHILNKIEEEIEYMHFGNIHQFVKKRVATI
ncbi:nucleotide sugar dehydrogenase [Heyndrickxia sporothermodurans]